MKFLNKYKFLSLFLLLSLGFGLESFGQVYISELSYNPAGCTGSDTDCEYVVVTNDGAAAVDISGWDIQNGISYTFPGALNSGTTVLPAGGSLTVGKGACTNFTFDIVDNFGALGNGGETVELNDGSGVINSVTYASGNGGNGDGDALGYDNTGTLVGPVAPSPAMCSISAVTAVASCNGDDAEIVVTWTESMTSGTVEVEFNGGGFSTMTSPATFTVAGPTTAVLGAIVTVRDDCNNLCQGTTTVNIPECPELLCEINGLSASQVCTVPGTGDNSYTLDVSFTSMNGSAGGMFEVYVDPAATNNPTTLIGTYTPVAGVIAVPAADYPGDATDLEQGLQICVVDAGKPDCSDCTTLSEYLCVACDITAATATPSACDNNGTSPLDTDDFFTFTLDVTQMDAGLSTYTFDGAALGLGTAEAGNYGAAGYTSPNVTIGALAGTTVTITIVDDVDPTCTFEVMIDVPETCSACDIMVSAFPTCPAVGGTYDISYTIMNGVGPFTINGTAGLAATGTVTGFTYVDQNTKETLTIEDEGNPGCMIMYDVLQLNCAAQTVCDCTQCAAGGSLNINAQAAGNGNGYSMFYALVDGTGNVAMVNITGIFMVPDVDAMGNVITYEVYAVNVLDTELAGAQASVTVGAPFDAAALAGNFCADASCNAMFMEDCECLPDPVLTCPTTVDLCGDPVPLNLSDGNANTAGTSIVIYGGTCAAFIDNLGTADITDDVLDPALASAPGTYNLTVQLQSADGCLSPEVECIIIFTTNCDADGGKFDEEQNAFLMGILSKKDI